MAQCPPPIFFMVSLWRPKEKVEEKGLKYLTSNHPDVVNALSELPFDWFVFDMEHAPLDVADVEVLMMSLRGTGISPQVRVPWSDPVVVKRVLDIEAEGVLPLCEHRGGSGGRFQTYPLPSSGGQGCGTQESHEVRWGQVHGLHQIRGEQLGLLVKVESPRALDNLEQMLSAEEIEVAHVGPMDHSLSMGTPLQFHNQEFQDALNLV